MEALIIIGLILGGGYYWAIGIWYARVVATILFVPLMALAIGALFASIGTNPSPAGAIVGCPLGAVMGWFLAAWPMKYWQWKDRQYAQATRAMVLRGH